MSLVSRFAFLSSGLGLVLLACSGTQGDSSISGLGNSSTAACGNGKLDDGESCDTAIASGGSACPASCDDGNACTADTLSGEACTAKCEHAPITACTSGDGCCPKGCNADNDDDCVVKCGDGVVGPGEQCDTAIKSGPGACPKSCASSNACVISELVGSGCDARCNTNTIVTAKPGDGCCPAGATRATDSDCKGAYGESCTAPAQCLNGLCNDEGMCTKSCLLGAALTQCGIPGHFCFATNGGTTAHCYAVANTGNDVGDDKMVGPGITYQGRIDSATDADALVADLQIGTYELDFVPSETPSQLDIAVDIIGGDGTKVASLNSKGVGLPELGNYTVPQAQRTVFVLRSANGLQGNYTFKMVKKP